VKPTGDSGADNATVEALALEYLALEEAHASGPGLLGWIRDMPQRHTGIEVAFLEMVSCAADAGARLPPIGIVVEKTRHGTIRGQLTGPRAKNGLSRRGGFGRPFVWRGLALAL
jgi:hypothetical protein